MLLLLALVFSPGLADRVVAVVADRPVLHSDVLSRLAESGAATGAAPGDPSYEKALDEIIGELVIVESARSAGYYPSPAELDVMVRERLAEIEAGLGGEEQLLAALASTGMTMGEYRTRLGEFIGDQQAAQRFVSDHAGREIRAMPADPAAYLQSNRDLLEEELMPRHLGWILFQVLPSDSASREEEQLLWSLRSRILAGESFEDLARVWSEDPGSAAAGGDLGEFSPGDMTPGFESALSGLAPGEVSTPFRTPYGVHIARLDSRSESGSMQAHHILRIVSPDAADLQRTMDAASSVADSISLGLLSFDEAARRHSADPLTRGRGGDLGVVFVERMLPEAAPALSGLPAGGLCGPVPVQEGTAAAIFTLLDDSLRIDWSGYDRTFLSELVRSIAYEHAVEGLVDSLSSFVTVVRPRYED